MAEFKKQQRLRKPREFTEVFRSKPVVSSDRFFRVLGIKTTNGQRLGLAVSKKVDKRAVVRNRIKRIVRETFRHWCAQTEQTQQIGADLVFQARPEASRACNQNLQAATYQHLINIQNKLKDTPHAGNT